jgi:hypothetical protein
MWYKSLILCAVSKVFSFLMKNEGFSNGKCREREQMTNRSNGFWHTYARQKSVEPIISSGVVATQRGREGERACVFCGDTRTPDT